MRVIVFLTFILLIAGVLNGQGRSSLEKDSRQIRQEIETLLEEQRLLKKDKRENVAKLRRIEILLKRREALTATISQQLQIMDEGILENNNDIHRLTKELDVLKVQYAQTIKDEYKIRSNYDILNFIVSAPDFNELSKRVAYLRAYRHYRVKQLSDINSRQTLLTKKNQELTTNKISRNKVLADENSQLKILEGERNEKNTLLLKLKAKEGDLKKQLGTKMKRETNLKKAIAAMLRTEMRKTNTGKKNASSGTDKKALVETKLSRPATPGKYEFIPESVVLSGGFEKNRHKLPWPVVKGTVVERFGIQKIGRLPITTNNIGIYLETEIGTSVLSVYDGTVSAVSAFNHSSAVIVRHGKYITTYYNLADVAVVKGQSVNAGQTIGKVAESEDSDGVGKVLFAITVIQGNDFRFVDPEEWLRPR